MRITGRTIVAGVAGQPVAHSLSPILHNAWLQAAGIDGVYVAFPLDRLGFERFALGLKGGAVRGLKIEGVLGRPATNRQDIKLTLVEREPGRYEVQAGNIAAGSWLIALEAREGAGADPIYRTRRRLWIKP